MSFGFDRLKQTGEPNSRKKTANKWYETQDSISYWEDFFKQKMVWAETMRIHKGSAERFPRFGFDPVGDYLTDKTCFFATGNDVAFVLGFLNSHVGKYLCSKYVSILDDGGYLMQKIYLEDLPIPVASSQIKFEVSELSIEANKYRLDAEELIDSRIFELFNFSQDEIEFISAG